MVSNLSLDEQVSFVAGSLKRTADIANVVLEAGVGASQDEKDSAASYLLEYYSRVSVPSAPGFDFRSQYSDVMSWSEFNPLAVHYFNMLFWGCLGASLFTGSLPLSIVSSAAVIASYFCKDKLTRNALTVRKEVDVILRASDEVYIRAFEKLREEQSERAYASR